MKELLELVSKVILLQILIVYICELRPTLLLSNKNSLLIRTISRRFIRAVIKHFPKFNPLLMQTNNQNKFLFLILWQIFCFCCMDPLIAQPSNFKITGTGGGGAMFRPSISPYNDQLMFVSSDLTAGLRSEDGGKFWTTTPWQDLTAWTGTQVQFSSADTCYAIGLKFREGIGYPAVSTDQGKHWNPITSPNPDGILTLWVEPKKGGRLLASDWGNLYLSTDQGTTWKTVYTDPASNLYVGGVVWNGPTILVGTVYGLITSLNGGNTFAPQIIPGWPAGLGMASFTGAIEGGAITLCAVGCNSADLYPTVQAYEYTSGYVNIFICGYEDPNRVWYSPTLNAPDCQFAFCGMSNVHA